MTDLDGWTFERSGDCWIGINTTINRRTALKGTQQAARADAEAGRYVFDNGQNAHTETRTFARGRLNSRDE